MQHGDLEGFAGGFAAGDDLGGGVFDGGIAGLDGDLRLGVLIAVRFCAIENDGN